MLIYKKNIFLFLADDLLLIALTGFDKINPRMV